jgi:succinoglycan biosynthesis protein ExoA
VIIPCRNERGHIGTCLDSTLNQMQPTDGFEVIVADGMSDDGTREILQRLEVGSQSSDLRSPISDIPSPSSPPRLRVIDNPGRIVSKGLNAAIRAARGGIILRMDAHTEYAPDYVRECVAVLQATGADNAGGPARTKPQTFLEKAVSAAYHSPFAVGGARFHDVNYEGYVDTVTYGCWRRETFDKFGYFDEELVRNQDDEHNLRIIRGGGKIYQSPKIKSWYRSRGSLGSLFNQYMQYGYWKVRVIQKHKLPASWRHLVPGAFVLILLSLFLLSAFSFLLSAFVPGFPSAISIFSFQLSAFSFSFLAALGAYLFAVLAASVIMAAKTEWKLLPILPFVFPCYHFGYGIGFLKGIWDFVICRKAPGEWAARLTRSKQSAANGAQDCREKNVRKT